MAFLFQGLNLQDGIQPIAVDSQLHLHVPSTSQRDQFELPKGHDLGTLPMSVDSQASRRDTRHSVGLLRSAFLALDGAVWLWALWVRLPLG